MNGLSLTIERTGQFSVNFNGSNESQCGLAGTTVLTYKVKIGCEETGLNEHGFIIDNNHIQGYFDSVYRNVRDFESCERIACKACRDFHAIMDDASVDAQFIEVTISGNPLAGLAASWRKPVVAKRKTGMVEIPGVKGAMALRLNTRR
jgi:hypothetical protein